MSVTPDLDPLDAIPNDTPRRPRGGRRRGDTRARRRTTEWLGPIPPALSLRLALAQRARPVNKG